MNECQNGSSQYGGGNRDHCVNGKIFQTAKQMFIHTGNLTNWSRSDSKVVKSTTEEVCCLKEITILFIVLLYFLMWLLYFFAFILDLKFKRKI